jgi:hypothetical protein
VQKSIFHVLYVTDRIRDLDLFYEHNFGPEKIPFGSKDPKRDWDVHRHNIGLALACLRYGIFQLKKNAKMYVIVGRGKHFRVKGGKILKEELLHSPYLKHVTLIELNNPGLICIKKSRTFQKLH